MAKILVIEDDDPLRRMVGRILTNAGHQIVQAAHGVEGLRMFQADEPDVVITDIVMPHRDGLEIIREIRAAGSVAGVIAISGGGVGSGKLYLSISEMSGADAVVQKPFRAEELIAAVDDVLERRRA